MSYTSSKGNALLIALGLCALMAMIGMSVQVSTSLGNRTTVRRINRFEGIYSSETAAWTQYNQGSSNQTISVDNNYESSLPTSVPTDSYSGSQYTPGKPISLKTTAPMAPAAGDMMFARYNGTNLTSESAANKTCGAETLGKQKLHVCLAKNVGKPAGCPRNMCGGILMCDASIDPANAISITSYADLVNKIDPTIKNYYRLDADITATVYTTGQPQIKLVNSILDGNGHTLNFPMISPTASLNPLWVFLEIKNSFVFNLNIGIPTNSAPYTLTNTLYGGSCVDSVTLKNIPGFGDSTPPSSSRFSRLFPIFEMPAFAVGNIDLGGAGPIANWVTVDPTSMPAVISNVQANADIMISDRTANMPMLFTCEGGFGGIVGTVQTSAATIPSPANLGLVLLDVYVNGHIQGPPGCAVSGILGTTTLGVILEHSSVQGQISPSLLTGPLGENLGSNTVAGFIGDLIAPGWVDVSNSFSLANIDMRKKPGILGGFAGRIGGTNDAAFFANTYNAGSFLNIHPLFANDVGGTAGYANSPATKLVESYYDTTLVTQPMVGQAFPTGSSGYSADSHNFGGQPTSTLQNQNFYGSRWDFTNTWKISPGQYPTFQNFYGLPSQEISKYLPNRSVTSSTMTSTSTSTSTTTAPPPPPASSGSPPAPGGGG